MQKMYVALSVLLLSAVALAATESHKYVCINDTCKDKGRVYEYEGSPIVRYCPICKHQLVRKD